MESPESLPKSRIIAELRVTFEKSFDLHGEQLDALEAQYAPQEMPPEWVTNAFDRLASPYFQWLEDMEDAPNDLENFGKAIGALKFATESALNIAPLIAWQKRFGNEKEAKKRLRPLRVMIVGVRGTVRALLHKVQEYPANETTDFYKGYHFALKHNLVDQGGKPVIKNEATKLYFFLIAFWKTVEQQQSFGQLHAWLSKFFPRDVLGDIERLKGICKKIKLHLGRRGRPKKLKK